jgi:excisionase family DNA binding protein
MNPYDKLDQEHRAWSVGETAAFLGYSKKYVYQLIYEGKIEGWMKLKGGTYRFCPIKLKAWLEKQFREDHKTRELGGTSNNSQGEKRTG